MPKSAHRRCWRSARVMALVAGAAPAVGKATADDARTSSSSTTAPATSARPSARSSAPAPTSTVTADFDAGAERRRAGRARRRRVRRLHGRAAAVRGDWIIGRRLAGGRPVLGICVGMQVLFERGVEHGVETEGLRRVARHGRAAATRRSCRTWAGTPSVARRTRGCSPGWTPDARFYFVHSYAVRDWDLEATTAPIRAPLVTWADARRAVRRRGRERCAVRPPSSTPRSPATPARAAANWLEPCASADDVRPRGGCPA